jgi:aminopeptidase N
MHHHVGRRNLATLSLVLVLVFAQASLGRPVPDFDAAPQTPNPSRPLPPPQYIPDHNFDTRHIALDLRFDWDLERVIGIETMTFKPLIRDLGNIELDAANMTITSVKLAEAPLKYETDVPKEKIRIALGRLYQPSDELTLVIEYITNSAQSARVRAAGGGLRFIKPTVEDPKRTKQIWSQGESEYNHFWFPVYDHPNDFFTSELTATVEKPLSVISNGALIDTRDNTDGTRTFHWKIEQPHASYLTSIVVGEYIPIIGDYEGIPIVTNVYPSEIEEGKITTARLSEMVKFFSEKTGLKYPYAKYAQTTVRDFSGAMENISATTQSDVMIHDARTELDQNTDGVQSHELAHQWFGDYLTCRYWSDLWLNESFAVYFQAMWDEHKLGGDDFLYSDIKANQDAYFTAWKLGNRHPIVTRNYSNPDAMFDTYAYPRGGAVLHMLRKTLGEDNWWRAINYYLHKYANQPVETGQFRIAIEESTGQSMDWFFDEWLYRMGHPVFRVTQSYEPSAKTLKLSVEQVQTIDAASQFPQVALFQTPVEVEIQTASATRLERVQIMPKKEQGFTFAVDSKPLLVNFDYHGTLIKEVQFDKTTEDLVYQLTRDDDVLGRIWALSELAGRVNSGKIAEVEKRQIAAALSNTVTRDKFWGVRFETATALASVKDPAARNALIAAARDSNARVRAQAITSLALSKDPALASFYQQFLSDPSYGVIKAAALAIGETRVPGAFESLIKLLDAPSWRDNIRASALLGLAALRDKRALDIAFRFAQGGNAPQVRVAALRVLGGIGAGDPKVFTLVSETTTKAFESEDLTLGAAAAEALVNLGDPRGIVVLDQISQAAAAIPRIQDLVSPYRERLRRASAGAISPARPHQ